MDMSAACDPAIQSLRPQPLRCGRVTKLLPRTISNAPESAKRI